MMMRLFLHCLCLVTLLGSNHLVKSTITDDEEPIQTYPARRAIDGSRGRKYYVEEHLDDGHFDSFGSSAGQYDPLEEETDLSDIRNNIPGEPGIDYPAYTRLPQTGFVCEAQFRGYYADEAAGCQVFHVCDGTFLVSSFLCPIGAIFSQRLLTCDWWSKVDCSATRNYHAINSQSLVSEVDDDEILRKAFEMASVQSAGERIPAQTVNEQKQKSEERRNRVLNYGISSSTQRGINELQSGSDNYQDYPDYPSRSVASRYRTSGQQLPNRQRYQTDDYYTEDDEDDSAKRNNNPKIRVHTIGEDRKNDRQDSSRNEFRPSYAPTVPTVTTTARSFYSPTIPTTHRPSSLSRDSSRYDLEVESSDHLYTARGRSDETIKAATPPTIIVKNIVEAKNVSLPTLVNGAMDKKDVIEEHIEESETSDRKTVTLPDVGTNLTKIEATTEEIITIDDGASENITETLSILTIDNKNLDPAVFSYSRDEEETNVKIDISATPETTSNSTETSNLAAASEDKKPAEFLQPPQKEEVSEFRITVLEEFSSTTPESVNEAKRRGKNLKKNSTSGIEASHVTPILLGNDEEIRESRIIRLFVNKNESNVSDTFESVKPQNSTEKTAEIERIDAAIKKIDAEILSRENNAETEKIVEDSVRKTEEAAIVVESSVTSTSAPTADSTPNAIPKLDNLRSIDINNLAALVAVNEQSTLNDTTTSASVEAIATLSEEKDVEDHERSSRSEKIPAKHGEIIDSVNEASTPFQVTLTVNRNEELDPNGEVIRKLIAQQEVGDSVSAADFKNFEIIKSEEPDALTEVPKERIASSDIPTNLRNDRRVNEEREGRRISDENLNNFRTNGLQSTDYYRNVVALVNGPNAPRPFSLGTQQNVGNVEIKTPSDLGDTDASTSSPFVIGTSRNEVVTVTTRGPNQTTRQPIASSSQGPEHFEKSSPNTEVTQDENFLEKSSQNFGERKSGKEKLIFELPHPQRSLDFETGFHLQDRAGEPTTFGNEDIENLQVTEKNTEKLHTESVVETEVIPSLGFSLNTAEERETYMDAVIKGLLPDVRATETTKNDTETSAES